MKSTQRLDLIMTQLLSTLENLDRILRKYGSGDSSPEVIQCKALVLDRKYEEFLERVNSPKWWGEGSISDLALFPSFIQEPLEYRDAASFEESLLCIAKILKENGIENHDAKEWTFRAESWPYRT